VDVRKGVYKVLCRGLWNSHPHIVPLGSQGTDGNQNGVLRKHNRQIYRRGKARGKGMLNRTD